MKIATTLSLFTMCLYSFNQPSLAQNIPKSQIYLCNNESVIQEPNSVALGYFQEYLHLPTSTSNNLIPKEFNDLCSDITQILDNNQDQKISRHELSDPLLLNQISYLLTWGVIAP